MSRKIQKPGMKRKRTPNPEEIKRLQVRQSEHRRRFNVVLEQAAVGRDTPLTAAEMEQLWDKVVKEVEKELGPALPPKPSELRKARSIRTWRG